MLPTDHYKSACTILIIWSLGHSYFTVYQTVFPGSWKIFVKSHYTVCSAILYRRENLDVQFLILLTGTGAKAFNKVQCPLNGHMKFPKCHSHQTLHFQCSPSQEAGAICLV